jgi:lysophospholipase L1-like esterase
MKVRSLRARLVLSFAIALLVLGLAELALAIRGFRYPLAEFPILMWNPKEDRQMRQEDYLFAPDVHCLWGLRPGCRVDPAASVPERADERINEGGYRGPLRERARAPGTLRVLTFGDSSTFGLGVAYAETYSAELERALGASGVRAEVLDFGVVGYTIRQGIERYRRLGREYRPDVVVAAFGTVNEHWAAIDLDDREKLELSERRSHGFARFARWVRSEVRLAQAVAWIVDPRGFDRAWKQGEQRRDEQYQLSKQQASVDWTGLRRVSLADFAASLRELRREVESDGARLVLVAMPRRRQADHDFPVLDRYTRTVLDVAAEEGLQVLCAHGRFRDLGPEETESALFLDFWHPSPAGHRQLAEWLAPIVADPARNRAHDPDCTTQ